MSRSNLRGDRNQRKNLVDFLRQSVKPMYLGFHASYISIRKLIRPLEIGVKACHSTRRKRFTSAQNYSTKVIVSYGFRVIILRAVTPSRDQRHVLSFFSFWVSFFLYESFFRPCDEHLLFLFNGLKGFSSFFFVDFVMLLYFIPHLHADGLPCARCFNILMFNLH